MRWDNEKFALAIQEKSRERTKSATKKIKSYSQKREERKMIRCGNGEREILVGTGTEEMQIREERETMEYNYEKRA